MNEDRIRKTFAQCRAGGRAAFIAYVTAGDPDYGTSLKIVDSLVGAGVDILELGVPFADPLADGEANQLAAQRAIASGMTARKVLALSCEVRRRYPSLPLVLFTYLNPVAYSGRKYSFDSYCRLAAESGVDAVLPLDLPADAHRPAGNVAHPYKDAIFGAGLGLVTLVAPTSTPQRTALLARSATSFVYYVSREGVTGEGKNFKSDFSAKISGIRKNTDLPVVVGFGISEPAHVRAAAATGVDGVVVGSAIVRRIEALSQGRGNLSGLKKFVSELAGAAKYGKPIGRTCRK